MLSPSRNISHKLKYILAFLGSFVLAANIPWDLVFTNTTPTGGDNPAHPALMQSIANAFLSSLSLIHYSDNFWGGFEAFQFYFPLPYLTGGLLAKVVAPNCAYKLITVVGLLFLPPAFFLMCQSLGLSLIVCSAASLFSVPFLYTEAHIMWGGNIYSDLAGMIGNCWAFVFFVITFGRLVNEHSQSKFSLITVICLLLTALSHFYGFLMLGLLFLVFILEDLFHLIFIKTKVLRDLVKPYLTGLCGVLCMSWWLVPLISFKSYSSEFGGDWNIILLETLNQAERWIFIATSLLAISILLIKRGDDSSLRKIFIFTLICTALFYGNKLTGTSAFVNVRLWPSLYFSGYLLFIVVLERWLNFSFKSGVPVLFLTLFFLIPNESSFRKSNDWMKWNYSGVEVKQAGKEFSSIIAILNQQAPNQRVSFESNGANNSLIGSVRAFELIPFLTQQNISEGGIVNSATFPGIPYMLQCLTSKSCAGWPSGSIMPYRDVSRAISLMKEFGVQFHIAIDPELRKEFEESGSFDILFSGKDLSLLKLKEKSQFVEVYDRELEVIKGRPNLSLLNFPRWDLLRESAFEFQKPDSYREKVTTQFVPTISLFNYLNKEWRSTRRVKDGGWQDRVLDKNYNYLNSYLISWRNKFNLDREIEEGLDFYIADRNFDTDISYVINELGYTELLLPLIRPQAGKAKIEIYGQGYKAYIGNQELILGQENEVDFEPFTLKGFTQPSAHIYFKPEKDVRYRNLDIRTLDKDIYSGLPGEDIITLPQKITSQCKVETVISDNRVIIKSGCLGKPHIIKLSYFPRWRSIIPIRLASNGFMVVTPQAETTILERAPTIMDVLAQTLTILGLICTISFWLYNRKSTN